jgi:hypothetical protein
VIKQRFLGLALALALLGSIGFAATASAQTDSEAITLNASVADVLILNVNTSGFSFGTNLNFLGQNANYGVCDLAPGARYISPDITTTVWSNRTYDVTRFATGDFPEGRIFVKNFGFSSCADTGNGIPLIEGPETIVDDHLPAAGAQDTELFLFDVLVDSPSDTYDATVTYEAIAQP